MAVLRANTDKDCEFSTCVCTLKSCDHVATYLESKEFTANKLPRPNATNFPDGHASPATSLTFPTAFAVITLPVCTASVYFRRMSDMLFAQALQPPIIIISIILTVLKRATSTDRTEKYCSTNVDRARTGTLGRLHLHLAAATGRSRLVQHEVDWRA